MNFPLYFDDFSGVDDDDDDEEAATTAGGGCVATTSSDSVKSSTTRLLLASGSGADRLLFAPLSGDSLETGWRLGGIKKKGGSETGP